MNIKIEVKNLDELVKRFEKAPDWTRRCLKSGLNQALKLVRENAQKEILYKDEHQHIAMSIKQEVLNADELRGRIWLDPAVTLAVKRKPFPGAISTSKPASYAMFLHEGTRAHFIPTRERKSLRWVGGDGKFWYSKGHWVSGIVGNKFIYLGAEKSRAEINAIFARQVDRAINQTITDSGRILL